MQSSNTATQAEMSILYKQLLDTYQDIKYDRDEMLTSAEKNQCPPNSHGLNLIYKNKVTGTSLKTQDVQRTPTVISHHSDFVALCRVDSDTRPTQKDNQRQTIVKQYTIPILGHDVAGIVNEYLGEPIANLQLISNGLMVLHRKIWSLPFTDFPVDPFPLAPDPHSQIKIHIMPVRPQSFTVTYRNFFLNET